MTKESNFAIEKLFGSKTRTKLLKLFFGEPAASFYVREITRAVGEQVHSVRRELANLENLELIKKESFERKIYYSANQKHIFCKPLAEMFGMRKVVSVVDMAIREKEVRKIGSWIEQVKSVEEYLSALVVFQRAEQANMPDLLVVGDDSTKRITHWLEKIEESRGKAINYVIMTLDDYLYRKSVRDKFLISLMNSKIVEVIDPQKIIKE